MDYRLHKLGAIRSMLDGVLRHQPALGVSLKTAIQHGVSSKSYWHMARTPVVQQAISNA